MGISFYSRPKSKICWFPFPTFNPSFLSCSQTFWQIISKIQTCIFFRNEKLAVHNNWVTNWITEPRNYSNCKLLLYKIMRNFYSIIFNTVLWLYCARYISKYGRQCTLVVFPNNKMLDCGQLCQISSKFIKLFSIKIGQIFQHLVTCLFSFLTWCKPIHKFWVNPC